MMPTDSIGELHKQCSMCGLELPLDAFWRQKPGKYGRQARCKPCQAIAKAASRAARLEEYRARDRAAKAAAYAADPEGHRAKSRAFAAQNPEKVRASINNAIARKPEKYRKMAQYNARYHLLRQYGLTWEEFEAMFERQNGLCPICTESLKRGSSTHIDHDHDSGAIRGLLCSRCNQAIGLLRESTDNMERAIAYLRRPFRWR